MLEKAELCRNCCFDVFIATGNRRYAPINADGAALLSAFIRARKSRCRVQALPSSACPEPSRRVFSVSPWSGHSSFVAACNPNRIVVQESWQKGRDRRRENAACINSSKRKKEMSTVSPEVVVEYLQMSNDKIYDMAQRGELLAIKIRQQWRFSEEEVDAWRRSCSVNAVPNKNQRKGTRR